MLHFCWLWTAKSFILATIVSLCYLLYLIVRTYLLAQFPTVDTVKIQAKQQVLYLINSGNGESLIQHLIDKRAQQIVDSPEKYSRKWFFSKIEPFKDE